jgi:hypothetical protein
VVDFGRFERGPRLAAILHPLTILPDSFTLSGKLRPVGGE